MRFLLDSKSLIEYLKIEIATIDELIFNLAHEFRTEDVDLYIQKAQEIELKLKKLSSN